MKVGKLDSDLLKEIVFNNIKCKRNEVLARPKIGEDCAVIDYGEYACVLSTDPITGAANEVGKLAVHISCNDVASNGVEPLGLLLTIMVPEGTTKEEINEIMKQASEEAAKLNVEIIGGHTEITNAVNKVVISSTAIGRQFKDKVINTSDAQIGDSIVMTKYVGLEGTGIIAHDREEYLKKYINENMIKKSKKMLEEVSVVKEGVIAGKVGVSSMHDITEGGLLGAVWEMCQCSNVGAVIYKDSLEIKEETKEICKIFDIDPLRLISSGCMIITVKKDKEKELLDTLENNDIMAKVIGEIIPEGKYLVDKNKKVEINPPKSDELYKAIR